MKFLLVAALFLSFNVTAKEAVKKNTDIKGFVSKLKPSKGHYYWFSMRESSTPYYADEKLLPCLEKSMTDNKMAYLTVNTSFVVLKCNVR